MGKKILLEWIDYCLRNDKSTLLVFEIKDDVRDKYWSVLFDTEQQGLIDDENRGQIYSVLLKYPEYITRTVNCAATYLCDYYKFKDEKSIKSVQRLLKTID